MQPKPFEIAPEITSVCRDESVSLIKGMGSDQEIGNQVFPGTSRAAVESKTLPGTKRGFFGYGIIDYPQIIHMSAQFLGARKVRRDFRPDNVVGH